MPGDATVRRTRPGTVDSVDQLAVIGLPVIGWSIRCHRGSPRRVQTR